MLTNRPPLLCKKSPRLTFQLFESIRKTPLYSVEKKSASFRAVPSRGALPLQISTFKLNYSLLDQG